MSTVVTIVRDGDLAYVRFRYDARLVEIVRGVSGRLWCPEKKAWTVPASQVSVLRALLRRAGVDVLDANDTTGTDGGDIALQRRVEELQRANRGLQAELRYAQRAGGWANQLLGGCAPDVRERVFRVLAPLLHPDTGGDVTLMQQLNDARAALKSSGRGRS